MSVQARMALVAHPNTLFSNPLSQRADLLDPKKTHTDLIAFFTDLCIVKKRIFYFTAINSDHHDDSHLGAHSHTLGHAADGWFCAEGSSSGHPIFLAATDPGFLAALRDADLDRYRYQIGLAGEAWTQAAIAAAGPTAFQDFGGDHLHLGVV